MGHPDIPPALLQAAAEKLAARQAELRAMLQAAAGAAVDASEEPAEVSDFKDMAAGDTEAAIDEAAQARAMRELAQIAAALHRLEAGRYGLCEDCGEPIAERRLLALPASAFCTACQAAHEQMHRGPGH